MQEHWEDWGGEREMRTLGPKGFGGKEGAFLEKGWWWWWWWKNRGKEWEHFKYALCYLPVFPRVHFPGLKEAPERVISSSLIQYWYLCQQLSH